MLFGCLSDVRDRLPKRIGFVYVEIVAGAPATDGRAAQQPRYSFDV
jgi:hypothetical protein